MGKRHESVTEKSAVQAHNESKKGKAYVELKRVVPLAIRNCWEAANRYRCPLSSWVSVGSRLCLQEGLGNKAERESFRTSTDRRQAELWSHNILLWLDTRNFPGHSLSPSPSIRWCGSSFFSHPDTLCQVFSIRRTFDRAKTRLVPPSLFSYSKTWKGGRGWPLVLHIVSVLRPSFRSISRLAIIQQRNLAYSVRQLKQQFTADDYIITR